MYANPIQHVINALTRLPSVGQRTAERFVFYLLKSGKKNVSELTLSLKEMMETVQSCEVCWDFSDQSPCNLCSDKTRQREIICVVSEPQDVQVIERTGSFKGIYHVLRGTLRPNKEQDILYIKIKELLQRAKLTQVKEIILALNPDMPGETTMMYLQKKLSQIKPDLKITRLARGLPMGSDLQYADNTTLISALKNRIESR